MNTASITRPIIEALYVEALGLADAVRDGFGRAGDTQAAADDPAVRLALSVEGLRTTTRVMHILAWLLNRRSYYDGGISEFQLRRCALLAPARAAELDNLALLPAAIVKLIGDSERLHARVARLDADWHHSFIMQPTAVERLRERLTASGGN